MTAASVQDRDELERRCRARRTRRSRFTGSMPTKWHPTSLRHPVGGEPFTPDNCWSFIADQIVAGAGVEEIVLKKPAGKRGFVLKLAGHSGTIIYVKLQLLSDIVFGRSFHESSDQNEEDE